tara:strand:- start:5006 stop:6871 length:1866 start_codon:yes stop_codon:yes gene_type:complete
MAKKNIDFNVYERANPDYFVDWGKAAADITKTFETIRDDRQRRKDELDEAYRARQEELNDIGEYENPTLQQRAIEAYDSASQQLANHQDLMKRGLIKPRDNTLFQHNVKTGFELFKKNATYYDAAFTEYANRTADDDNALQERYMANGLKGFIDLNNTQLSFNAETGQASFLKLEPAFITDESGKKVKNPKAGQPIKGQSMSLQEMTVFLRQRIDKFDVGASANKMSQEVGNYIRAELEVNGIRTENWQREYNKMEQALFDGKNEEGQAILTDKAEQMLANDQDRMDMMLRYLKTADGQSYKPGTRDEYEANGGDANKNNNIIVFEKDGTGLKQPSFSEEQEKRSLDYAKDQILSTLSSKETVAVQKIQKTIQWPPQYVQDGKKRDELTLILGESVNKFLTSSDINDANAAAQDLVNRTPGLNGLSRNGNIVTIQTTGNQPYTIDVSGMNGDQAMRAVYKAVGGVGAYDSWVNLGGKPGATVDNTINPGGKGAPAAIKATSFTIDVGGEETSGYDYLVTKLDAELDDGWDATEGEITNAISDLLNTSSYLPEGMDASVKVEGKGSSAKVYLTINGEVQPVIQENNVAKLENKIKNQINNARKKANTTGGGTGGGKVDYSKK